MRRANVLIVILLASVALLLIACGKDREAADSAAAQTTTQAPAATTATSAPTPQRTSDDGCRAVPPPEPAANPDRRRPRTRLSRNRFWTATITTNCGTISIRLAVGRAPKTASSFAALARSRFFDGLTFHRVAKPGGNDYVIQGGDPLGTGNGGPGYSVVEAPPRNLRYDHYIAAMAKTQTEAPGTSGSQFFIVTAPNAALPPEYALLGEVVGSKAAVDRIAAVPTDPAAEAPLDPVVMSRVRISSRPR
ncbi:MAG TPA: peptidylprolyl isomerase [Solirubrobacteraceae bacterium]|nr:peptidylprolyl isomerase [Solirubrobacteraceae bacterium]